MSFELRYGTWFPFCPFLPKAEMTSPKALKERLMFCASFSRSPDASVLPTRSEPAKSMRLSLLCSKSEFSKKYQYSKNEFRKKYQYSNNEFRKKYQDSKNEFRKKYQCSKNDFSKKYQYSKNGFSKKYQYNIRTSSVEISVQ